MAKKIKDMTDEELRVLAKRRGRRLSLRAYKAQEELYARSWASVGRPAGNLPFLSDEERE